MESLTVCLNKVEKIGRKNLAASLNSLKRTKSKYSLKTVRKSYPYMADMLPSLSVGNMVAVHWKQVVKILTEEETKKLEFWTNKVLTHLQ